MKEISKGFKISEVGQKDFPELEGKTIVYEDNAGYTESGVIVGCNLDVGITVVNVDDPKRYLICMTGSVIPGGGSMQGCKQEAIDYTVQALKDGYFKFSEYMRLNHTGMRYISCSGSKCAYVQ